MVKLLLLSETSFTDIKFESHNEFSTKLIEFAAELVLTRAPPEVVSTVN